MKKVIRLTERDLTSIVKKVITEQNNQRPPIEFIGKSRVNYFSMRAWDVNNKGQYGFGNLRGRIGGGGVGRRFDITNFVNGKPVKSGLNNSSTTSAPIGMELTFEFFTPLKKRENKEVLFTVIDENGKTYQSEPFEVGVGREESVVVISNTVIITPKSRGTITIKNNINDKDYLVIKSL
jgi:hypothetical protein